MNLRTEAEGMQDSADHDDVNAQRAGERHADAVLSGDTGVQVGTRSQAALVRESLVRCPPVADARTE
jgi:hypothetical protein